VIGFVSIGVCGGTSVGTGAEGRQRISARLALVTNSLCPGAGEAYDVPTKVQIADSC
jgi:hypothetical protein